MDSITFNIGDTTIKLAKGEVRFWSGDVESPADIVLNIKQLQDALSTAHMLIRETK